MAICDILFLFGNVTGTQEADLFKIGADIDEPRHAGEVRTSDLGLILANRSENQRRENVD